MASLGRGLWGELYAREWSQIRVSGCWVGTGSCRCLCPWPDEGRLPLILLGMLATRLQPLCLGGQPAALVCSVVAHVPLGWGARERSFPHLPCPRLGQAASGLTEGTLLPGLCQYGPYLWCVCFLCGREAAEWESCTSAISCKRLLGEAAGSHSTCCYNTPAAQRQ